ncbi:threonine/serine dehydratase [Aestuariispira insulae]|uniref:L-threonine ammonia-lyase n=1 Tax=Aestuariispira insulae TaxID=1461337 RepID=A0A3D9HRW6_9PROT|nr:threonine/serine dehydratase [Aestuariispira insulae]RED52199.1 L-threonine ammonia-lyase [Aestuariispira insulae]
MTNGLFKAIQAADERIKLYGVQTTPLETAGIFSDETGTEFLLKGEHLQLTGSFKMRGAMNKVLCLTEKQKQQGIITASSGNHGMATARAAKLGGTEATIYLPETVSPLKLANIKRLGATPVLVPGNCVDAERAAHQAAQAEGRYYISPYGDMDVIAGQGTIGLELTYQLDDFDAVYACVGGGGLISGIGSYLQTARPDCEIIGCWPEKAAAMYHCLERGEIWDVPETDTLSDGSAGGVEVGTPTFPICQQVISRKVLVTEEEIKSAMRRVAEHERYIIEGAAAVAVAAALKTAHDYKGARIAVILCGRNISLSTFQSVINEE